jgi:hypothetical protein
MSEKMTNVKNRAENFSEAEKRMLAREMVKHDNVINRELSPNLTNAHKNLAWGKILASVNAVASSTRSRIV